MNEKIFESSHLEKEPKYLSRVLMHFNRHADKTKNFGDGSNEAQVLTSEGKKKGIKKGEDMGPAKPTAVAFGGHIVRSQEMGGFIMAGAEGRDDITGDEDLEELKEKLNKNLKYGTRLAMDSRLSFSKENPASDEAYEKGEGLKWNVEEGDEFIKKQGKKTENSYSRASADVTKVIKKYITIAPRFNKIVSNEEKMKQYGDTLERFMGSHSGKIDFFFCKIVEKLKGVEERDKVVKMLGNQGFDYGEGFDIDISMMEGYDRPQLRIIYERKATDDQEEDFIFDEIIPEEVLEEIIKDGEDTR